MKFSTTIGFLLLSVAAAADTKAVFRMHHQAALVSDGLTLTEAGWCAKCQNDWDNEDNGCADQKDDKRDKCAYRNRNVPAGSDDTAYPTSAPTEDDRASKAAAKLTLTEAGWCAKCQNDWDNEDNGCADQKDDKRDNCEYRNRNVPAGSDDTAYPTSAPTEDDKASKAAVKLTLTEAGWCAKCQNDWDNEDNGCADQKDDKRDKCAYRNRNVPAGSDDTAYPTSAPTEDDKASKAAAKLTLTEAGWCAKCQNDWDNEDNGCAAQKDDKRDKCAYRNRNVPAGSDDTAYPTSAPTEDDKASNAAAVARRGLRGAK